MAAGKEVKFWLVTGADYARSIKWSKTWVNPIDEAIKKLKEKQK